MKAALAAVALLLTGAIAVNARSPQPEKARELLIDCFSAHDLCGESEWDIADTLDKESNKTFLLSQFQLRKNAAEKRGIIHSLYRIHDPEIAAFYKQLISDKFDDGENLYYPLNYLAKQCDQDALRALSGNGKGGYKGYPGCQQWETTVELFGKCKYKRATPYLIESLDAACLNIAGAASDSLHAIFPASPDFDSIPKEQAYFRRKSREKN